MAIFRCENALKQFPFRNLREKQGKKCNGKFFFLVIWGSNMGSNIDDFTKNGHKSSKLSIFHREKAQNDKN